MWLLGAAVALALVLAALEYNSGATAEDYDSDLLDEIAEEMDGKIKVGKVNVDEEGELAARFGIMSIPTVMVFKNGEVTNTSVGFCPKEELLALL